jgi:hypothetical protein
LPSVDRAEENFTDKENRAIFAVRKNSKDP